MIGADTRRAHRVRTFLRGKLSYGNGAFSVDCAICDISPTGARIRVEPGATVPETVYLVHIRERTAFEATVKWRRKDGSLGLRFNTIHDLNNPNTTGMKLLRRYCTDS